MQTLLKKFLKENMDCKKQFEEYMNQSNYYIRLKNSFRSTHQQYQPE